MPAPRGELFAGVTVAIVTPFAGGEIDWPALGGLIEWHVSQGTDALAPCGTTGESPTLTHDENEKIVAFVCEKAAGRIKIMAGTGSTSACGLALPGTRVDRVKRPASAGGSAPKCELMLSKAPFFIAARWPITSAIG